MCSCRTPCDVVCYVSCITPCDRSVIFVGFRMILMYISHANKAPARSLDACLGEGVAALMPAPPFSPVAA